MNDSWQLVYRGKQLTGQTTKTHTADGKTLTPNRWQLIGFRINGATWVKTYIHDGSLSVDSHGTSVPYATTPTLTLVLGSNPFENSPGNFFRGYIRSMRGWAWTTPSESSITGMVASSCALGCSLCGSTESWCAANELVLDLDCFSVATPTYIPDRSTHARHAALGPSLASDPDEPTLAGPSGVFFSTATSLASISSVPLPSTFSIDIWFRIVEVPSVEASLFQKSHLSSLPAVPGLDLKITGSALNVYLMAASAVSFPYTFSTTSWHNILISTLRTGPSATQIQVSINDDYSHAQEAPALFDEAALAYPSALVGATGFKGYIAFLQITNFYRAAFSTVTSCGATLCPLSTATELPLCADDQYPGAGGCQPCDPSCVSCIGGSTSECTLCTGYTELTPAPVGECASKTCDSRCDQCSGPSNSDCVACLYGGGGPPAPECHCEWDHFFDQNINECSPLANPCEQDTCASCTAPTGCLACSPPYLLVSDTEVCVLACPTGYHTGSTQCTPGTCDARCSSCSDGSLAGCLTCTGPVDPLTGLCSCPPSQFYDGAACTACISGCAECTDSVSCVACAEGYLPFNGSASCILDSSQLCAVSEYFDAPAVECKDCDVSCASCFGGSSGECLSCPTGTRLDPATSSCQPCSFFTGLTWDSLLGECSEICGDGIVLGGLACDDGGAQSGDGCSQDCLVEDGFACSGSPSVCVDIQAPYVVRVSLVEPTVLEIQFSEELVLISQIEQISEEVLSSLFALSLSSQAHCLDGYSAMRRHSSTQVHLLLRILCPIADARISVETSALASAEAQAHLSDSAGNALVAGVRTAPETLHYEFLTSTQKELLSSLGAGCSLATALSLGFNIGVVLCVNGTLEAMWGLVNLLQMVAFVPLMRLHFPPNVYHMFRIFLLFNGNVDTLQQLLDSYVLDLSQLEGAPFSPRFEEYGFESTFLLRNSGVQLALWLLSLSLYPVVALFTCICPRQGATHSPSSKCCARVRRSYGYNGVLRALVEGFLDLVVSVSLNLARPSLHRNFSQTFNTLLSLGLLVLLLCFLLLVLNILTHPRRELQRPSNERTIGMLYENIRLEQPARRPVPGCFFRGFFYCFFLVRRGLFGASLVTLEAHPALQLFLNIGLSVMFATWVLLAKPFKTRDENFLFSLNEVSFVVVISLCSFFLDAQRDPALALQVGWLVVGIVVLTVVVNCGFTLVLQCQLMRHKCRLRRRAKRIMLKVRAVARQKGV